MAGKTTYIELTDGRGLEKFAIEVAERLLTWKRSGWSLPSDSRYEWNGQSLVKKKKEDK